MNEFDLLKHDLKINWKTYVIRFFKKPVVIVFFVISILGLIGIFSINSIMQTVLHRRPEVDVPVLEGRSLTDSLHIASELGLSLVQEGTDFNEGLPAGTIVRQHPPSGMRVREGRAIHVVVSKGGQAMFVPQLLNKALPEAQSILAAEHFQVGSVSSLYSADVAEGFVLSQVPSSGTIATKGAMVDIILSKGYPPANVPLIPNFVGQSVDAVRGWVSGVGGSVDIKNDSRLVGSPDIIVRQFPIPGQPFLDGTVLRLTVPGGVQPNGKTVHFEVPSDKSNITVRIVARNNEGENEIYKQAHVGGDSIDVPLKATSVTRVRFYIDDALIEEKVVEP